MRVSYVASHPRYLVHSKGRQVLFFPAKWNMEVAIGLGLIRGYFGHHFVGGHGKGDGQLGFVNDLLAQVDGPLIRLEVLVHPGQIKVELINGGFFKSGALSAMILVTMREYLL